MTITFTSDRLPTRAEMWGDEATGFHGAMSELVTSAQLYGVMVGDTSPINGQFWVWSFFIRAGTYTIYWLGAKDSFCGIVDWYLDPPASGPVAFLTGQDWYSAGTTNNVAFNTTLIVPTDGVHILRGVINGKNASSSNFNLRMTKIWLQPVAD